MKINFEAEQKLIAILLNKPSDAELVSLSPDDFMSNDNKAIYAAIKDDPSAIIDFYGKARKNGYSGNHRLFDELGSNYINDNDLNLCIKAVKRNKYEVQLQKDFADWQNNPFTETIDKMQDSLNAIQQINQDETDGTIGDALADIYQSTFEQRPEGIKTYPQFDRLFDGGLYDGMLFSIGARPAVGKSAFAVNFASQVLANNKDVQVDIFTLEMSQQEVLMRFLANYTQISKPRLKSPNNPKYPITDKERKKLADAMDILNHTKLHIYDQHHNLANILNQINTNASRARPQKYMAIIDYIGLVQVSGNKERYLQIGEITRGLKMMASKRHIPIIALTQLNRGVESRNEKEPKLSDIRESGDVEQDSNVVGFLWNPPEQDLPNDQRKVRFSIKKNREGPLGDVDLAFVPKKMTMAVIDG